jgi:hypothetical protein
VSKFVQKPKNQNGKVNGKVKESASVDPITPVEGKISPPQSGLKSGNGKGNSPANRSVNGSPVNGSSVPTAIAKNETRSKTGNGAVKPTLKSTLKTPIQPELEPITPPEKPKEEQKIAKTKAAKKRKPLYRRPWLWALLIAAAGLGSGAAYGYKVWQDVEAQLPESVEGVLTYKRARTMTVKASDGTVLQEIGPVAHEKLEMGKIPNLVVQAFISSEDRRFLDHSGVDYQGIARASLANLRSGTGCRRGKYNYPATQPYCLFG